MHICSRDVELCCSPLLAWHLFRAVWAVLWAGKNTQHICCVPESPSQWAARHRYKKHRGVDQGASNPEVHSSCSLIFPRDCHLGSLTSIGVCSKQLQSEAPGITREVLCIVASSCAFSVWTKVWVKTLAPESWALAFNLECMLASSVCCIPLETEVWLIIGFFWRSPDLLGEQFVCCMKLPCQCLFFFFSMESARCCLSTISTGSWGSKAAGLHVLPPLCSPSEYKSNSLAVGAGKRNEQRGGSCWILGSYGPIEAQTGTCTAQGRSGGTGLGVWAGWCVENTVRTTHLGGLDLWYVRWALEAEDACL